MELAKIRVTGLVQGVSFRYYAGRQAKNLGLTGFARNDPDGSVYLEVEGQPAGVTSFIQWCHQGSPSAKVSSVTHTLHRQAGHKGFDTY